MKVRKFIVEQKTFDKVSPQQIDMAIETAKAYNLNPFKREVHFTAYNGELKIIVGMRSISSELRPLTN
jgi:hypothetical protein